MLRNFQHNLGMGLDRGLQIAADEHKPLYSDFVKQDDTRAKLVFPPFLIRPAFPFDRFFLYFVLTLKLFSGRQAVGIWLIHQQWHLSNRVLITLISLRRFQRFIWKTQCLVGISQILKEK